jgi:hypothetical protein
MSRVVALKSHSYLQRWRPKGETYEAKKRDVPILEATKLARRLPDDPPSPQPEEKLPTKIVRDMEAEESGTPEESRPKRRYRRRDIEAES